MSLLMKSGENKLAMEIEKQFKQILQQRMIQSQREKELIEEALIHH